MIQMFLILNVEISFNIFLRFGKIFRWIGDFKKYEKSSLLQWLRLTNSFFSPSVYSWKSWIRTSRKQ